MVDEPTKIAPWGGSDFGTCLFGYYYTTKRAYGASPLSKKDYFFLETVKKPFRGFSLTSRSAGRSTG
jgi:hypothetical protein